MSSKSEKDRAKQIQDKCQNLLTSMLRDDDNKYCVDCDAKGPRWASWNLGIFLCIRCAGIHRNLGVHISRVKSVNLDAWTPDQVVSLQQMGNSRARAVYEALLPDGFRRPQTDSSLEAFVRAKYEQKKYLAREWVPPPSPKVDWDKEIDEEIERQKKKKKSANATGITNLNTSISNSVIKVSKPETVPQLLPKPNAKTSSSPKTTRSVDRPTVTSNADLLGLDISKTSENQEDMFSGFLSAEPQNFIAQKPEQSEKDILKSEEENFFNQPAPTEKEKTKLTKDSIMALYGSGTATSMPGLAPNCPGYNFPPQNVQFQNPNVPVQFQNQLNNFQVQGFPNTQYQNGIAVSNQFQGQILPQNTFQQFNLQSGMPSQFQVGHPSPNFQQFNVNYSTPPQNQQMNMQFASQQFQQFNMYPQNGGMH